MRIERIEIFLLRLPLSQSFDYHGVSRSNTENVVVRLLSDGLEGYGESVPRTYVTGESAEGAFETLGGEMLPDLSQKAFGTPDDVRKYLSAMGTSTLGQRNLAAFCAFELALIDLCSKYWDVSLEYVFGVEWNQPPPYTAVIPILPLDRIKAFLTLVSGNEMRTIKFKVDKHMDGIIFEHARSILGPAADLRVDANGAWTAKEALKNISLMKPYGIRAVEQPVAKENTRGLREVTEGSSIPIIADESVCSVEDAKRLVDSRACHGFNIRISKCGGFLGSFAVRDIAKQSGLKYQIGCQAGETGILSAAGRHLAGWFNDILYLEGSFGQWVLREDIVKEDIRFGRGGEAPALGGTGLGIHVDGDRLHKYAVRSEYLVFS